MILKLITVKEMFGQLVTPAEQVQNQMLSMANVSINRLKLQRSSANTLCG
jgi:hypothetical protein